MREFSSEGGCLCGAIRFRIAGRVLGSAACHCRDCQYVCGGAAAYVIIVPKSAVSLAKGALASYVSRADSGAVRTRQFCGTCGTPLFAEDENFPDVVSIKVGSLDDRASFKPDAHFWMQSAPAWHQLADDAPRFAKGPNSGS